MRTHVFRAAAPALLFALWAPAAPAQDGQAPAPEQPQQRPGLLEHLSYDLGLRARHDFRADLEDAGSVSVSRTGADLTITKPFDERTFLRIGFDYEASLYDFKNAQGFAPGAQDPMSETNELDARITLIRQIDQRWGWLAGGFVRAAAERGADLADGVNTGGFFGVSQRFDESFSVTLGVGAQTRLEESAIVIPLIIFDWRPSETTRVWSQGLGVNISSAISEEASFRIFGRWEPREYRLADDNATPEGALEDERVVLGVGLTWRPNDATTFEVDLGSTVYQEYSLYDRTGDRVASQDTDPSVFIAGRIVFRF